MMGLRLSRRARLGLLGVLLAALILFFPMRLAFGILQLGSNGVSARGISGSIWSGRIVQLTVGDVPVGTVNAGLSPVQLFVGRARVDIWRKAGQPDDISGALSIGFNRVGVDDMTGSLSLGAAMAPLPISGVDLTDVSARFAGKNCSHAEGQVKARIAGQIAGLNLSQGLSGAVQCDGISVLLPLVSQSGLEKLNLRLFANGSYAAEMLVQSSDPILGQTLAGSGFTQAGDTFALRIDGTL